MASEIALTCKITVSKGGMTGTNATSTKTLDMTGTTIFTNNPSIGTSYEALVLTDVDTTADHWILLRNMDATNFVWVAPTAADTYASAKIPPGGFTLMKRPANIATYLKADTAACEVEVVSCEA